MNNTITLTDEQMESLSKGESITIAPPKEEWSPKGGEFYIDSRGEVGRDDGSALSAEFGMERETSAEADAAIAKMRVYHRLWYDHDKNKWVSGNDSMDRIGAVYMTGMAAKLLAHRLNEGEVTL